MYLFRMLKRTQCTQNQYAACLQLQLCCTFVALSLHFRCTFIPSYLYINICYLKAYITLTFTAIYYRFIMGQNGSENSPTQLQWCRLFTFLQEFCKLKNKVWAGQIKTRTRDWRAVYKYMSFKSLYYYPNIGGHLLQVHYGLEWI